MNMVPAIGFRTVYSWDEVMRFLGMTRNQVHNLVYTGRLPKRYKGLWPFDQGDLNAFISQMNTGRIVVGLRNRGNDK